MKWIVLQLILCMVALHASWGTAVGLLLPDAIQRADIIAHIRIEDDLEIPQTTQPAPHADDPHAYTRIATASLLHAFKRNKGTGTIRIKHTNGFGCPNVTYQKGEEYIVFLRKEPDSDDYITLNFDAGQFKMEGGQVIGFYLIDNYRYPDDFRLPSGRVFTFLKASINP